jgi:hypothetical protein
METLARHVMELDRLEVETFETGAVPAMEDAADDEAISVRITGVGSSCPCCECTA